MSELRFEVELSWSGSGRAGAGRIVGEDVELDLRRSGLPADEVRVAAHAEVTGYPERARFAHLRVSPTVAGGDPARVAEYEQAAEAAHARCFIGRTLAEDVDYRVGSVAVEPAKIAA